MFTLSRFLKIGLPVATVATATMITASLICLHQADDKDKKYLNNQLLDDFQEPLDKFQEQTVSYATEPSESIGDSTEKGPKVIDLGSGEIVALGPEQEKEGGISRIFSDEAGDQSDTLLKLEETVRQLVEAKSKGASESSKGEEDESLSNSASSVLQQEGGRLEPLQNTLGNNSKQARFEIIPNEDSTISSSNNRYRQEQATEVSVSGEGDLINEESSNEEEQSSLAKNQKELAQEKSTATNEQEKTIQDNSENRHEAGIGTPKGGVDPYSDSEKQSKELEEDIRIFQELGVKLQSNNIKLLEVLT